MFEEALVTNPQALWEKTLLSLQEKVKPHNFNMWVKPILCQGISENVITLRAPNRWIKEWFEKDYLQVVVEELELQTQKNLKISLEVDEVELPAPPSPSEGSHAEVETGAGQSAGSNNTQVTTRSEVQVETNGPAWELTLNPRYTFDNFIEGSSNQVAHGTAKRVAASPGTMFNPLFIYGGVGLGKTHLLCAIGNEIKRHNPTARIAYLSAEQWLNQYVNYIKNQTIEQFRRRYRDECEVLLIDDIQLLGGKGKTQEEFFHTFNALHDNYRQIVITADKPPEQIQDIEDRLKSRFKMGMIADILQPELETRLAILKKKAEQEKIPLSDDVALFLAEHIKSNVRELEGSLIRIAAIAGLQGRSISIDFARDTLRQYFHQAAESLTVEAIQKEVSNYFEVKVSDLKGPKRHKALARPRQIAMYLTRKLTRSSFPEIGQRFGGKDHTTAMSACKRIDDLMKTDLKLRSDVEKLERNLSL